MVNSLQFLWGCLSVIFTHVYSSTLAVSRAALTSSVMPELWMSADSSLMLLHAEVMSLYVKTLHITVSSIWTSTSFFEFCNKAKPYMKKDFMYFVHFTFNALSEIIFYHMGSTSVYCCEIAFLWHLAHLHTLLQVVMDVWLSQRSQSCMYHCPAEVGFYFDGLQLFVEHCHTVMGQAVEPVLYVYWCLVGGYHLCNRDDCWTIQSA